MWLLFYLDDLLLMCATLCDDLTNIIITVLKHFIALVDSWFSKNTKGLKRTYFSDLTDLDN